MSIADKKEKIATIVFYIGIILELIVMLCASGEFGLPFGSRLRHLAFVCFATKILLTKYEKKEWFIIALTGILAVLFYFVNGEELVLCITTMILSSKGVQKEKVFKLIFWMSLTGTLLIAGLSLIGVGGQYIDVRDYGRGSIEARWCLGFGHANNFHGMVWFVLAVGLYVYFAKLKWQHYVLLSVLNIGLYILTISRTGLAVTQLVICAAWIARYYKEKNWKWTYYCGYAILAVSMILTLIGVIWGTTWNPVMEKINSLLSGRLEFAYWWADISRWHFFATAGTKELVDNGFAVLFCDYGVLYGCIYLFLNVLLIRHFQKNKNLLGLAVIVSCILYTLMEATFTLNLYMLLNFTYVLLIDQWYQLRWRE